MIITEELKIAVWNKARRMILKSSNELRQDVFGWLMKFNDFWNRDSKYGWEIDHIIPQDKW